MPQLESNILAILTATGGLEGGLTAAALAESVYAPEGRVRMTLRRLLDRGEVWITSGTGANARYLPVGVHEASSGGNRQDFGWGRSMHGGAGDTSAALFEQLANLRHRLAMQEAELARVQEDNAQLREVLRRRSAARVPGNDTSELHERLDALLQLCHPDRHDNSPRANETTRWLLSLRKERRGR